VKRPPVAAARAKKPANATEQAKADGAAGRAKAQAHRAAAPGAGQKTKDEDE